MPVTAELGSQTTNAGVGAERSAIRSRRVRLPVLPLRLILALAFGSLGFAATLALAALIHAQATVRLEQEVGAQLDELAAHMTRSLDQGMFERWRDLQVAASLDSLREPAAPVAAKRAVLKRLQETYPAYSILLFADPDGRVRATSNGLIEGADVSRRDYFLAGRERPFAGDVHDAILLAKLLPRSTEEPLRLVDLSAPVYAPDGSLAGVIAAHLDWTWARETVAAFERSLTRQRAGTEILLLGRDGTVLLGPPDLVRRTVPAQTLAGARRLGPPGGSRIGPWPDGPDSYLFASATTGGVRDYPGLGWLVVARVEEARALAPVRELSGAIVLSGALVAVFAALLAWLLAGRLARPLQDLADQAGRLGRGEPLPALPGGAVAEVRSIADAFRAAAGELRQREAGRRLLVDELNHRVKNTLATVQSFAHQSFRGLDGPAERQRAAFEGRLLALSCAHNILTRENWSGAELEAVIDEVVRPFEAEGTRFALSGPALRLQPHTALPLGMVLHELCTNAAKYGALSVPGGRVAIAWELREADGVRDLRLVWRESGGPDVAPPERRGFGSRLIERSLSAELGGSARIEFQAEGVICTITTRQRDG